MTVDEVLRKARAKIRLKKNWCQGYIARDKFGHPISAIDPKAVQWCALGAVRAVVGPEVDLTRHIRRLGDPVVVNDQEGHAAVMRLFDRAIKKPGSPGATRS